MQHHEQWTLSSGLDVIALNGEKLGEVQDAYGDYFIAKKGWLFPTEYSVPAAAISNVDDNAVYLNLNKDEAMNQGWDEGYSTDGYATGGRANDGLAADGLGYEREASATDTRLDGRESVRVPLSEEELTATRRPVDRGAVRVEKDVVAEEQVLDVPVTEERVHVSRRAIDRDVEPGEARFEEGTIEVPLHGEEVDVQKRAHVAEEIELSKEEIARTERVSGTVRHEEARVVDDEHLLDDDDRALETVMLGLRLREGLPLTALSEVGRARAADAVESLVQVGLERTQSAFNS